MSKKQFLCTLCILIALFLCLPLISMADTHHATASPTPVPYSTVKGTVVDVTNNAPIKDAQVKIGTQTLMTDNSGSYQTDLPVAVYTATASKNGYDSLSDTFTLEPMSIYTLDFKLAPKNVTITGTVSDATNPSIKLSGVRVTTNGASATTDSNGHYTLSVIPGSYTLTFEKSNYIATTENTSVGVGQSTTVNCSMSRELSADEYRVVLTWTQTPYDYDSHLYGRQFGSSYHVYYSDKKPSAAEGSAMLDVDDTSNGGPETTTFKISSTGTYIYAVYDYSCRSSSKDQLQRSGCKVQVYSGNRLVQTLNVPTTGYGRWWRVFTIRNGVLSVDDYITDTTPAV